jgi:hypothetical protein
MTKMMTAVVALALTTSVIAGEVEKNAARIPSVKSGTCSITLLDADGIKPLAGAKLSLKDTKDAKVVLSTAANEAGLCKVTVADGRYVLTVNEKPLTLLDATKDGKLAWCRIVVSDKPMLIGGQDPVETGGFTFLGLQGPAAYGAAGLAGLGGAAGVVVVGDELDAWDIDGIDDGDDKDDEEDPTPGSP